MNQIMIGFSTPKKFNLFSWLIRHAEGSEFSHAFIALHEEFVKLDTVFQASGTKVNEIWLDKFKEDERITDIFVIPVTDEEKRQIEEYCIKALGSPYSVKDIIGFGWVLLGKFFGQEWNNPFDDGEKEYFCSKLTAFVLDKFTGDKVPTAPRNAMPKSVYDALITIGAKHIKPAA